MGLGVGVQKKEPQSGDVEGRGLLAFIGLATNTVARFRLSFAVPLRGRDHLRPQMKRKGYMRQDEQVGGPASTIHTS